MKHITTTVIVGGLLVGHAVTAGAQSLADVARQEQERRKAVAQPARVYTDADVQKNLPLTTAAARPASAAGATGGVATEGGQPADPPATGAAPVAGTRRAEAGAEAPADEAGWRAKVQEARDGLARSRRLLEALEQQAMRAAVGSASALAAGQQAAADPDDAARTTEIQRLRGDVDKFAATLSTIEEQARRAGVPPGWVR